MDYQQFSEIEPGAAYAVPRGQLHVRATARVAVFAHIDGCECFIGAGEEVRARVNGATDYWFEPVDSAARAFGYMPAPVSTVSGGEVFTSIDRKPMESGHMAAIRQEMRLFELERRSSLRESRAALDEMRNERRALEALRKPGRGESVDRVSKGEAPEYGGDPFGENEEVQE